MTMNKNYIKLALIVFSLNQASTFTFFYQDSIDSMYYDQPSAKIVKVLCKPPPIEKISENVTNIFKEIVDTYDFSEDSIEEAEDDFTLALKHIDIHGANLLTLNTLYEKILSHFPSGNNIEHNRESILEIDANIIDATEKTLILKYTSVKTIIEKYATISLLQEATNDYTILILELYQIIESIHNTYNHFRSYYDIMKNAKFNIINDQLISSLTSYNDISHNTNYEIINFIKIDGEPVIFLKEIQYQKKTKGIQLFPIFYKNFGLENDYYLDSITHLYQKHSMEQLPINEYKTLQRCLDSLNKNNHNKTLAYCKFIYNPTASFQVTTDGILFNDITPVILGNINQQLGKQISENNVPFHISFENKIEFHDPTVGNIQIERSETYNLEKSEFTETYIQYIATYLNEQPTEDINMFLEYITLEYHAIIVNFSIFLTIYIIYIFIKNMIKKYKYRTKRMQQIHRQTNRILKTKP